MADVFDTKPSGQWKFKGVASTLLKSTTLGLDPKKVEFASGPDLKPTHDAQYWAEKPAASTSRAKTAFQPSSTTRSSGKV